MPKRTTVIFTSILLTISLLGSINTAMAQVIPKIIGGKISTKTQWPWAAGLIKKEFSPYDGLFCGASLISPQWLVTAAHCVIDEDQTSFDVTLNRPDLSKATGERISIDQIIIHPNFNNITLDNDLALIRLQHPTAQPFIPILSRFSPLTQTDTQAIALGWGTLSAANEIYPRRLREVDLSIINKQLCVSTQPDVNDNMLCAGDELGEKDTCLGDSGGPLIAFDPVSQSWRLIGITSWGVGCAQQGAYGIYTHLKNYISFISNNICSVNDEPIAPLLKLYTTQNIATADWTSMNIFDDYQLIYSPTLPLEEGTAYSIDFSHLTHYSTPLPSGASYYVSITSRRNNCISSFSNIEHLTVQ